MQRENDPNDGPGDTPDRPDVWISQGDDGSTLTAPGDNQPAVETNDGQGHITIDFDQPMDDNSEPVDVSGDDGANDPADYGSDGGDAGDDSGDSDAGDSGSDSGGDFGGDTGGDDAGDADFG